MTFVYIERRSGETGTRRLRVKLENVGHLTLTVAIQASEDGVNWTTTCTDHISIPSDPKKRS